MDFYLEENRQSRRTLHIEFYYYTSYTQFDLRMEQHDDIEIMGVVSGACVIPLEDRQVRLTAGKIIFLNAQTTHGLLISKSCRMYCIRMKVASYSPNRLHFGSMYQDQEEFRTFCLRKKPYAIVNDYSGIGQQVKELIYYFDTNGPCYNDMLLWQILLKIMRESNPMPARDGQPHYVEQALETISASYQYEFTLEDLSKAVGLNPSYLGRIFKQRMGVTPMEYVQGLRLNRAKALLRETDAPIVEICNAVGLSSRQYFNKLFKQKTGMSPGEYRRRNERQIPHKKVEISDT